MRFTLYYDGPLPSASNNSRLREKQHIRKEVHKQLLELWKISPILPNRKENGGWENWLQWKWPNDLSSILWAKEKEAVFPVKDFKFVPLIRKDIHTVCHLDILFLRPDEPGKVIQGGDIDNRLKTLFDALRVPTVSELEKVTEDHNLNDPFFCLLEDDALISGISVRTDRLLSSMVNARSDSVRLDRKSVV